MIFKSGFKIFSTPKKMFLTFQNSFFCLQIFKKTNQAPARHMMSKKAMVMAASQDAEML